MPFCHKEWKMAACLACEIAVAIPKSHNVYRICSSSDVVSLILGIFFSCISLKLKVHSSSGVQLPSYLFKCVVKVAFCNEKFLMCYLTHSFSFLQEKYHLICFWFDMPLWNVSSA